MFARVIPIRRLPDALSVLDYDIPETLVNDIAPGVLVKIPFGRSVIFGVVESVSAATTMPMEKIKPISAVVVPGPILPTPDRAWIQSMSNLYHSPIGFLYKTILPPLQPNKLKKLDFSTPLSENPPKKVNTLPPVAWVYETNEQRADRIHQIVKNSAGQVLLLVPEIPDAHELRAHFPESALLTSETTPKELFALWWRVRTGAVKMVIGTRRALFLGWHNLTDIIIDDEGNPNHKSFESAPLYHTRDAAIILARQHQATLSLMSHTLSVETKYFCDQKVYRQTELSHSPDSVAKTEIEIINMRDDRRGGNQLTLSRDFYNLANGIIGSIFIFVNRRGSTPHTVCKDCGYIETCTKCKRSLVFHNDTNQLKCHYCNSSVPPSANCRQCHGPSVVSFGAGTQQVENEIRTQLPNREVVRIDSDIKITDVKTPADAVYIGTQLAWQNIPWDQIQLMVFVDPDTPLYAPEFRAAENQLQLIRSAAFKLPVNATLQIQTNHPEHIIFQSVGDPAVFYKEEIANRQQFSYPPYSYILKLYTGDKLEHTLEQKTTALAQTLTALTKSEKNVILSGPISMTPAYLNGQYWQVIIIKIPYSVWRTVTAKIAQVVPDTWKIDPNPDSLLSII